jgi:hypothetical protein
VKNFNSHLTVTLSVEISFRKEVGELCRFFIK